AAASADFQPGSGTVTFEPADYSKTISVATLDDIADEGEEAMYVDLSGPTSGAVISRARGVGTIWSEDAPPPPPPASQAPTPQGETVSTARCGEGVVVDVLANDTDPDGNYPLNLSRIESISAGFATIEDLTNIRFTPGQATGTAQVRYLVVDSTGVTAAATLFVTLTGGTGPCQ
ncbi:MAG TPA: Ig-like domain-containing protein, partial [Thermoanaerobaculia bacterium]